MSKFLYPIYKLKTKSYIKWWLYHKKAGGSGVLSEILEGFSFNLENTLNRKFKLFEIEGNSVQDGSPSPETQVPILSSGDNGSINEKIKNADGTEEQDYSIFVQQPFRSIGDVRDKFVKVNGNWYERHYIGEYIANNDLQGNGMTDTLIGLLTPILNIAPGLTGINFTSIVRSNLLQNTIINNSGLGGTNGDSRIRVNLSKDFAKTFDEANAFLTNNKFKIEFVQKEPLDLPCTQAQIEALENKPSTYKDFTIIQSEDETPAYLKIQYYKEG